MDLAIWHTGRWYSYHPKSRQEYWEPKFARNIRRDAEVKEHLAADHVRQIVVWECTVKEMRKDPTRRAEVLGTILAFLKTESAYIEL